MNDLIIINNTSLGIKEYNGQRVVTFKDIDVVHQRPDGTAKRNFIANRKHFFEGEDFFKVCVDEIRSNKIFDISPKAQSDIILLTESGYLMLVKSFTDELAWSVQRQLVNSYFRVQKVQSDFSALSPQLQFMIQMEQRQNALESAVKSTNQRIDNMREVMQVKGDNWRKKAHNLVNRIASASGMEQSELYTEIYEELEFRAGCDLDVRYNNLYDRLYERGYSQSKLDRLNNIDVIASDKKLTEIYLSILKEYAVKYSV